MFGEFEYDPTRQFGSVSVEEQLDALGRAVVAGKVGNVALWFWFQCVIFLLFLK